VAYDGNRFRKRFELLWGIHGAIQWEIAYQQYRIIPGLASMIYEYNLINDSLSVCNSLALARVARAQDIMNSKYILSSTISYEETWPNSHNC
jgi:hypothetical protein